MQPTAVLSLDGISIPNLPGPLIPFVLPSHNDCLHNEDGETRKVKEVDKK